MKNRIKPNSRTEQWNNLFKARWNNFNASIRKVRKFNSDDPLRQQSVRHKWRRVLERGLVLERAFGREIEKVYMKKTRSVTLIADGYNEAFFCCAVVVGFNWLIGKSIGSGCLTAFCSTYLHLLPSCCRSGGDRVDHSEWINFCSC